MESATATTNGSSRAVSEANRGARPTAKQVFLIARLLCEQDPRDHVVFPTTRQEASDLIGRLNQDDA